jgi:hypothetical protein
VRTINGVDPRVATTLSYDVADRLTTIAHGKIAANPNPPPSAYIYTPLATLVYSYDSGGRLKTENNAEGLATYSYDDTNQLTGVDRPGGGSDESFGYDANGNRNTTGYTVTTGNRITSGGGYTFTYDAEGNTSARTQLNGAGTSDDVVTTFSYDHRNRLTGATEKTNGTLTMRATYTYDALGRRIKTDVDADGAGGGAAVVTWHLYDDQNTYADFDSGGTLAMRYLYGPAIDELLARTDSGGTSAWYLTDRLGTVRDIVNTSGGSIWHGAYNAFGTVVSETGPAPIDSSSRHASMTTRQGCNTTGIAISTPSSDGGPLWIRSACRRYGHNAITMFYAPQGLYYDGPAQGMSEKYNEDRQSKPVYEQPATTEPPSQSSYPNWPTMIGYPLIISGLPVVPKRPTMGPSPNTSLLSISLDKIPELKKPVLKPTSAPTFGLLPKIWSSCYESPRSMDPDEDTS